MPKYIIVALLYFFVTPLLFLFLFHTHLLMSVFIIFIIYSIGGLIFYIVYPQIDFSKNTILRGPKNKNWVMLTFDDGPSQDTPQLLDLLRKYKVPATFFLLGEKILRYPSIAQAIVHDGHSIGNHTFSHEKLTFKNKRFVHETISQTQKIIQNNLGIDAQCIRAPHGFKNVWLYEILNEKKLKLVSWTKSAFDTENNVTSENIKKRIVKNIKNGDIILLHDGRGMNNNPGFMSMIHALPEIIIQLKKMNFEFVTLTDIVHEIY